MSDKDTPGGITDEQAFDTGFADSSAAGDDKDLRILQLEDELKTAKDKLMRAAADVQNIRKRADRERREAETYGGTKLARDLLSVYDNLDQALSLASDQVREQEAGLINGIDLTKKELLNAFAKHKITVIAPEIGAKFDANVHQAMFEAPSETAAPGSVIEVMQAGFSIGERLLRPAMVGVARASSNHAPNLGSALD